MALHENGITCAHRDTGAVEEGKVGSIEVVWAPADCDSIERDDEYLESVRLGAIKDGDGDLGCLGPVELVPPVTIAVGEAYIFD